MKAIITLFIALLLFQSVIVTVNCYTCPQWNTTMVDLLCKTLGPRLLPSSANIAGEVEYKSQADNCCYRLAYSHSGNWIGLKTGYCTLNWDTDDGKVDLDWRDTPVWVCIP
ncbi:hypothetical protein ABK040_015884 [Willaertia magna]